MAAGIASAAQERGLSTPQRGKLAGVANERRDVSRAGKGRRMDGYWGLLEKVEVSAPPRAGRRS